MNSNFSTTDLQNYLDSLEDKVDYDVFSALSKEGLKQEDYLLKICVKI